MTPRGSAEAVDTAGMEDATVHRTDRGGGENDLPRPNLVWFRDDLRIADNPALAAALADRGTVAALYVLDDESPGIRPIGGAARWWLHHSLERLAADLDERNVPLIIRRGPARSVVREVVDALHPAAVHWNRRYGGPERAVDAAVTADLTGAGIAVESNAASLLFEPGTIHTGAGGAYSVFTPFWKACLTAPPPRLPGSAPRVASRRTGTCASLELDDLGLLPSRPDWAGGLRAEWTPGEASAHRALRSFLSAELDDYPTGREIPSQRATSRLSPHLRWGEISPHQVWHAARRARSAGGAHGPAVDHFLREIGWREFAWHSLYHFPEMASRNWRPAFDSFPWPSAPDELLRAWQRGRTGYPLVDAGMRELWRTGWMHNRVRMVTASFLTKNLLVDWRIGEAWFWDTLVDADAAANPFNWQWVAGSGADAAPYFRVFNPEAQSKKFDADAEYARANIDEWGTPAYPRPIVDLAASRGEALAAYRSMRP